METYECQGKEYKAEAIKDKLSGRLIVHCGVCCSTTVSHLVRHISVCGCKDKYLWYDEKLGIWRCKNCGWCS